MRSMPINSLSQTMYTVKKHSKDKSKAYPLTENICYVFFFIVSLLEMLKYMYGKLIKENAVYVLSELFKSFFTKQGELSKKEVPERCCHWLLEILPL